ncbi:hypothetical protein B0I27_101157 [Arcticibacter pallidicorallinus]|uniref:ClbS/DfsB family four-helix bundle protein n=1 Tax=Arcticibacter pallidicorallinus TaxID=1259464 RepID=A0A2T0UB92_9SPHI|nr:ClbS/DfsB family four-helix bundle protein [Arcticibacter pallidicorallinus]PRY55189.1 hypothetical protein B0I27_101157 [Arcticibacter pallidicorallinus]
MIPRNKHSLQDAIRKNYAQLRTELGQDLAPISDLPELDGHVKGTKMSLNNLVAYLNGWGQLVLKWIDKTDKRETVHLPETGYKWNQLGLLAQKFYTDHEADDYLTLCRKLDETVECVQLLIESKTNEQLYVKSWYKQWPLGRMIQFNTSSPYTNATIRIRKWKKIRIQQEQSP